MIARGVLTRLARESGALLAELGVRPSDRHWIGRHAETIASVGRVDRARRGFFGLFYRLARRAARTAR